MNQYVIIRKIRKAGNNCLFCGKTRSWNSELWIVTKGIVFMATVCPKCRKDPTKTVGNIYRTIPRKVARSGKRKRGH